MGELIRSTDWAQTPLGGRERWSASLRSLVNTVVASRFPMALLWGHELLLIYNDAYREIAADKHPRALGRSTREIWPEVWHINQPIFAAVMERGEAVYLEDTLFPIDRNGRRQDAYFTLCYSPARDEGGLVLGTLVTLLETTHRVRERETLESERERAQAALRESEERLRLAIEATELGVFDFDPRTGRLVWSTFAKRHFGLAADVDVDYDTFLHGLHPDDRPRVEQIVRDVLRGNHGGEYTTEYRTVGLEDGVERWLSARGRVSFDDDGRAIRFVGLTQDISARKSVEAQTQLARARYATLFSVVREGFAHYRAVYEQGSLVDLLVLEINPAGAQLSGIAPEQQIGRTWREVWPDVDTALFAAYQHVDQTGDVTHFDHESPLTGRWYDVTISRLVPGEFVVTFFDITDRRGAEEALRRANDELREGARRKDEFIAILSHELRNPLAPVRMALPLLNRELLTGPGAHAIGVIERQVGHLTRLLDDLLDVSRLSTGKLELRPQRVTLESVVAAAIEAVAPVADAARHDLNVMLPDGPVWIRADLARLTQVVTNLLTNSAKYTPRGGRITVQAGQEAGRAVLRVRDNGIGIPARALPQLFTMFGQVNRDGTPQTGLGIGLALSKRLVEMHGGTIEGHSSGVGLGAEFVVKLPLAEEDTSWEAAAAATTRGTGNGRLKVLIVDDNEDLVEMLALVVSGVGHDVRTALDGGSAVAAALSYRPDVILLDLGLPVLSGLEVARELRRRPETAKVRLIAVTGWGASEDRARTRDAGFDHHLTKPVDPEALVGILQAPL